MREELEKKVQRAIKLIQSASKIAAQNGCPEIEVAYSGGKDSDVILELTKMSGVPYRAIYKNTTIDPSGTIKHAQDNGVEIARPKVSFREILAKVGIVSRFRRACCQYLKEYKILDYQILGIRADESKKRAERYKETEMCRVYNKKSKARQYFPILDWTKQDVLEFIEDRGIKLHSLYYDEQGNVDVNRRLGCLCCPMQSQKARIADFKEHPNMVKMYIRGGKNISIVTQIQKYTNSLTMSMNGSVWLSLRIVCGSFKSNLTATTYSARRQIARSSLRTTSR